MGRGSDPHPPPTGAFPTARPEAVGAHFASQLPHFGDQQLEGGHRDAGVGAPELVEVLDAEAHDGGVADGPWAWPGRCAVQTAQKGEKPHTSSIMFIWVCWAY